MTLEIIFDDMITDPSLPVMPHGHGVVSVGGETPYRWLADELSGDAGTPIVSWREKDGAGTLTGGGASLQMVAGYKSVAFDGSNSLSIPAGAPLPSSRGSIVGVARLSPAALAATRYGLIGLSSSANPTDGRINKDTDGTMLFDRLGTTPVTAKSTGVVNPGDFFTFGFSQRTSGAVAMLNGEVFAAGAGDLTGFNRLFVGASGGGTPWIGNVFEFYLWNEQLGASHFTQFHNAMKEHFTFIQ